MCVCVFRIGKRKIQIGRSLHYGIVYLDRLSKINTSVVKENGFTRLPRE